MMAIKVFFKSSTESVFCIDVQPVSQEEKPLVASGYRLLGSLLCGDASPSGGARAEGRDNAGSTDGHDI